MIRIGLMGYGNLARGVECAVAKSGDMELAAVFTRRDPAKVTPLSGVPVIGAEETPRWADRIDVLILCGGSANDLPEQTPHYVGLFNCVDSFDTHARAEEHFCRVDAAAKASGHTALVSAGWDPGLFSVQRMLAAAVLPQGVDYTFWGKGVSQGHSDAIRRIPGVKDARQYTVPVESAVEACRSGADPVLTTRQKHTRECYVVPEEGADLRAIERAIVEMPNYFADYDTTVHFITEEELKRDHAGLPHGGFVLRSGRTGWRNENRHIIEYRLKLDSNPEFTGSVLAACARAVSRLSARGCAGCFTMADLSVALLSEKQGAELRAML